MTKKYYLVKEGTSERITDREGKPILYSTLDDADHYSYEIASRLGTNIGVMSVEEYLEEFWLYEQQVKRDLNERLRGDVSE